MSPQVSVLLPVHDGEEYLAESITSVLRQSHGDFELLVIDDGSSDGSRAIAEGFADARVRVLSHRPCRGLVATLNRGLELARGELVARQDADDVSHPRRLERQVSALARDPELALVGGQGRLIDRRGRYVRPVPVPCEHASIRWYLLFDNAFIHSAVTFRSRIVLGELNGYPDLPHCEDYALWSRVAARARVANLRDVVVSRRAHPASLLRSLDPANAELARRGNRAVISSNLSELFGADEFSASDVELIARLREGVPRAELAAFETLFRRLRIAFRDRDPAPSRDLRRTLALQYAILAHGQRRVAPASAVRLGLSSVLQDPTLALGFVGQWVQGRLSPRA